MVRSRRSIIHCFGIWSGRTLLLAILIAGNFSAAAVADEGPAAPTVQLGIEGVVKRGCWAQARIDSDQSIATLNGYDGAGFPLQTTTLGRSDVTYLKVGRRLGRLTASMNDGDLPAVALDLPDSLKIVSSLQQCMLVVGGDVGLKDAVRFRRRSSEEAIITHQVKRPGNLPVHPLGYDGVDAVLLCTSNATWMDQWSESQFDALDRWVREGGRLVICGGVSAEAVFGDSGRLKNFLPGEFAGLQKQREANGLEAYAKAGTAIKMRDEVGRITGIPSFRLNNLRGRALVTDGVGNQMTSWLVHAAYGLGSVLLVSTDLDAGPIAAWKDRPRFVAKILDAVLGRYGDEERDANSQFRHLGFTDLSGQLRATLDQFDGVWLVPFSLIAGLLAVYVLLLGPLDFLALKYFGGHMHWTWITFPLLVLGFAGLSGIIAHRTKSDAVKVNQADLLDVDIKSGTVRTTTWAHLYSPTATAYSLHLDASPMCSNDSADAVLSWQGLPGAGFSGLEGQGALAPIASPYRNLLKQASSSLTASLGSLGISARSSRSVGGTWTTTIDAPQSYSLMIDRDGLLSGTFTNSMPFDLRDCAMVCDQWYYKLGSVKSGQVVQMNSIDRPLNFGYRLNRRSVDQRGDREFGDMATPWDRASFDLGRIMEMMMFHQAAGGRGYTKLLHQFHRELDLSDHLDLQVAIIFGRMEGPASQLTIESDQGKVEGLQPDCESLCRILIPVSKE